MLYEALRNPLHNYPNSNYLYFCRKMDHLHVRLQNITGHQLDILPILQYLKNLQQNLTAHRLQRLNHFQLQWSKNNYADRLKIAYISGSWSPLSIPGIALIQCPITSSSQ